MTLPNLPVLPDHLYSRGGNPDLVRDELLWTISHSILNQPRSLQRRIGPSEIGQPCQRRTGYSLLGAEPVNVTDDVPWKPAIGTYAHAGMEEVFTQFNAGQDHARFLTEMRVSVGEIDGVDITGSCDLYDRVTATVVDWKFVGKTQLAKYKRSGPGPQYRSQVHLYGRGFTRRGVPVDTVMIAFLPRDGELRDAYVWHEPYDEQVALDALERANGIALALKALGPDALGLLETADQFCSRCPFYRANSTDLATGCPGDAGATAARQDRARDHFADLVG
jgi:hypothetical protein